MTKWLQSCALVSLLFLTGCASEPIVELQEAREALAMARDFEADIYAPDQYDLALMNLEMAEVEIEDQNQISALGRNYDRALTLLESAVVEAEEAQLLAEEFKTEVFLQAQETLPVAQTALDDAFDVLGQARSLLSFQEAQALDARLSEAAVSLNLARQLMDDGGFADALTRLEAVRTTALEVDRRARFVIETAPR